MTTLEPGAPTAGSGITFSNVTGSGFTVSWGAATDPDGLPVSYKVAWARQASAVDSIAEIEALSATASDWMTEATYDVPNLRFGADYAVAVLASNDEGKTAIYSPAVRFTTTKRVFLSTAKYNGNWTGLTKTAVDNSCQTDAKNPTQANFDAMILLPGRSACTNANCSQGGVSEHVDWVFEPDMGYSRMDGTVVFKTDAVGIVPQS